MGLDESQLRMSPEELGGQTMTVLARGGAALGVRAAARFFFAFAAARSDGGVRLGHGRAGHIAPSSVCRRFSSLS